jgi:rimK-like ATP-grasp domain
LGAQAIKVALTPEQEQIALKTAQISKLPWCAVDIMSLKGKNIDGYKDVVLEINASPGTDGITGVIKHNFINVMLNELDDPSEFMLQDKNAGFIESVDVKFDDNTTKRFLAKLDTGNSTGASTLEVGEYEESGNKITFSMDGKKFTYKKVRTMRAEAGEEVYERPVIIIPMIKVGQRKVCGVPVALVKNRDNKTTNMLLNRDVLGRLGYIIHPSQSHILTDEIQKVKIVN